MNILYIMPRFHTNQIYVMKSLINQGNNIQIIVRYYGKSEDHRISTPTLLGYSHLFKLINSIVNKLIPNREDNIKFERQFGFPPINQLVNFIKKSNPEIVIIRDIDSVYSIISFAVSKLLKKNVVFYTQIPKYSEGEKLLLLQRVLGKIFNVVWITPTKINNNNKTNVVNSTFYLPFVFEPTIQLKDKKYYANNCINILMIGKFQKNKNHIDLLKTVNNLRNNYSIKLTLLGEKSTTAHDIYYDKVVKFIEDNKMQSFVDIKLNMKFSEVQDEYLKNDLFIIPSEEPASVSLLEAMGYALPVISSDRNGTKCYIDEGINGYIFKYGDWKDLELKIKKILSDKNNIPLMGMESYRIVLSQHNAEKYYYDFCEMANKFRDISMS